MLGDYLSSAVRVSTLGVSRLFGSCLTCPWELTGLRSGPYGEARRQNKEQLFTMMER
jgi:hypothetical protein